jgi:PAS domain S-box-containing protein
MGMPSQEGVPPEKPSPPAASATLEIALAVADHVDAMLAYWDRDLICRFANKAYLQWFGKSPEEMIGKITIQELLGPLYEKNLPYIQGALRGERQTFERTIPLPGGGVRPSLADYYPDTVDGEVAGFFVHVADISLLKKLEAERERLIGELQSASREIKTLKGLMPICAWCKNVRDDKGYWQRIEEYISRHSDIAFTHSICNSCLAKVHEESRGDGRAAAEAAADPAS